MLESIFYDVLEMTIAASIVIAAVIWLFPKIDKTYTIQWRKIFWLILGIRLLIPYNFSLPNTPIRLFEVQGTWEQSNGLSLPISFLLAAIWVIGFILFIRFQYLQYKQFQKEIIDTSKWVSDENLLQKLAFIKEELLITRDVRLCYSDKIQTPMVSGIFKPILLLPKKEYEDKELDLIFIHECMHIDNYDILYKVLMTAVAAVHWFNPLIHKMVLFSFRDLELVCDACVAEDMKGLQRAFYAKTILDSIPTEKYKDITYSTCFFGNENIMKQRIDTIFDETPKKKGTFLLCAIFLGYIVLSISISCGYKPMEITEKEFVRLEDVRE